MFNSTFNSTIENRLRNPDKNSQTYIDQATRFFQIEDDKFLYIHTKALKQKYLHYLYLLKEFEIGASYNRSEYETNINLLEKYYNILVKSKLMELNHSEYEYSDMSIGLNEFDIRSLYQETFPQTKPQTVLKVGPKDKGIEPGFIGIQIHDLLCLIEKNHQNAKDRRKFLATNNYDMEKLLAILDKQLPRYIIKLDYKTISPDNIVSANPNDLLRSQTIQECYANFGDVAGNFILLGYEAYRKKSNIKLIEEAFNEVIATDIARVYGKVYGMKVHEQVLYRGKYLEKDILKLMLKAPLIAGAEPWLHFGGSKEGNFNNYSVTPIILSINNIKSLADQNVNYARTLALLLWLADRDKIGKNFNNFFRVWDPVRQCYDLAAFDFGKAFQAEIIDQLSPGFHINNSQFVNYTAFYGPREEMMFGMHILYRLDNQYPSDKVLRSYGDSFYEKIKQVEPNSYLKICNDYLEKVQTTKNKFTKELAHYPNNKDILYNIHACDNELNHIEKIKKIIKKNLQRLINKYKHYFVLEKSAIKLIELFEKVMSGPTNTSLRSEDGTVFLKYLRVLDKKIYPWETEVGYQDDLILTILLSDRSERTDAYNNLTGWLLNDKEITTKNLGNKLIISSAHKLLEIELTHSGIKLTLNGKNLIKLCEVFNEEKIKKLYHPQDYELYVYYLREQQLIRLLTQLESFALKVKLSKHPQQACYLMEINVENINIFINSNIKSLLKIDELDDKIQKIFASHELNNIIHLINQLIIYLEKEEKIKQQMLAISELPLNEITEIHNNKSTTPIYLNRSPNGFNLRIEPHSCNTSFFKIFMKNFHLQTVSDNYFLNYDRLPELHEALTKSLSEFKQSQDLGLTAKMKDKHIVNQLLQLYMNDKIPWQQHSLLKPSPNRIYTIAKIKKELERFNTEGSNDPTEFKRLLSGRMKDIKNIPDHKNEVSLINELIEILNKLSSLPANTVESPDNVKKKLVFS